VNFGYKTNQVLSIQGGAAKSFENLEKTEKVVFNDQLPWG
jgi:hypothetical protein